MPINPQRRPATPRLSRKSIVTILLGSLVAALILHWSGLLTPLSNAIYDAALRHREVAEKYREIVLIGVTNDDLANSEFRFSSWPRSFIADFFDTIINARPAVVGVDIFYSEASHPIHDQRLADTFASFDEIVGAFYFDPHAKAPPPSNPEQAPINPEQDQLLRKSGNLLGADLEQGQWAIQRNPVLPIAEVAKHIDWLGNVGLSADRDTILRHYPLVVRDEERFYPSLALQTVRRYFNLDWSAIRLDEHGLTMTNIQDRGTIRIPLDSRGRMRIPYAGNSESSQYAISVSTLLPKAFPPSWPPSPDASSLNQQAAPDIFINQIKGRIVLTGQLSTGSGDLHPTPVKPTMAGLYINAAIIRAILEEDFIHDTGFAINLALAILACLTIVLVASRFGARVISVIALILLVGLPLAAILLLNTTGLWLDPGIAVAAGLFTSGGAVLKLYTLSEIRRGELRSQFERHFGPVLADQLIRDPGFSGAIGKRKEATIFFSDLVGYTTTTEKLEPEETVSILNRYFEIMTQIAFRYEATVDQLMGDGLMGFFNDPVDQSDHAVRAVAMGLDMQQAAAEFSNTLVDEGYPDLHITIGIATGYVTVGLMGSSRFSTYTTLGTTTNLAARICDLATSGDILVNERTHALAKEQFSFEPLEKTSIKGMAEPVPLYRVIQTNDL